MTAFSGYSNTGSHGKKHEIVSSFLLPTVRGTGNSSGAWVLIFNGWHSNSAVSEKFSAVIDPAGNITCNPLSGKELATLKEFLNRSRLKVTTHKTFSVVDQHAFTKRLGLY